MARVAGRNDVRITTNRYFGFCRGLIQALGILIVGLERLVSDADDAGNVVKFARAQLR